MFLILRIGREPLKIVDLCAILGIFNIKKIKGPPINVGLKIEMRK